MSPNEHNDPQLRALFEREHTTLIDEPFLAATLERIAAERRRRTVVTRTLLAASVVAVVGVSPWLVAGSVLMTEKLDALFSYTAALLSTPLGMAASVVCVAAVLVVNRRAIF